MKKLLLSLSAAAVAAAPAHAASYIFNAGGTPSNWTDNVWNANSQTNQPPPGAADEAFIRSSNTAIVNSAIPNFTGLTIANQNTFGTVELQTNGVMTASGSLVMGGTGSGAVATFNITGGSATFSGSNNVIGAGNSSLSSSTINISSGSLSLGNTDIGKAGTGAINVTGGSLSTLATNIGSGSVGEISISSGTANLGATTIGSAINGTGTLSVSGGTTTVTTVTMGNAANTTNAVNISGGTTTFGTTTIGNAATSTSTVSVTNGTLNLGATKIGTSGSGTLLISGGTVNASSLSSVGGSSTTTGTGTINVSGTGRLNVSSTGDTYIGERSTTSGNVGNFTQSGGIVELGGAGQTGRLIIGSSNAAGSDVTGNVTISGGQFMGRMLIGSNVAGALGGGTLTVLGSNATIGSIATGNGLELRSNGEINFVMDSVGISTLNYANGNFSISDGAQVTLDITSYIGGLGAIGQQTTFTLINAANYSAALTTATLNDYFSVVGSNPYYSSVVFSLDTVNKDVNVTLTAAIPEPSTWALIGLGIFIVAARCRRRLVD